MNPKQPALVTINHKELTVSTVKRNEKGFPLLEDGSVDWELTAKEKSEYADNFDFDANGRKKKRNKMTNLTPPKKKRK